LQTWSVRIPPLLENDVALERVLALRYKLVRPLQALKHLSASHPMASFAKQVRNDFVQEGGLVLNRQTV
jgi:hypothetical protein